MRHDDPYTLGVTSERAYWEPMVHGLLLTLDAIHYAHGGDAHGGDTCHGCGRAWPCPTEEAADDVRVRLEPNGIPITGEWPS